MLEFTKMGKHWYKGKKWKKQPTDYWIIEFSGTITDRTRWNEPMECIYQFPKEEGIIEKFTVELPRERLRSHYSVYIEELGDNKIKVGFQLLKKEDFSDWAMEQGGFNTRVWVHGYETIPKENPIGYVASASKYSKVFHKDICVYVKNIKNKTHEITGKRECKRCLKR